MPAKTLTATTETEAAANPVNGKDYDGSETVKTIVSDAPFLPSLSRA